MYKSSWMVVGMSAVQWFRMRVGTVDDSGFGPSMLPTLPVCCGLVWVSYSFDRDKLSVGDVVQAWVPTQQQQASDEDGRMGLSHKRIKGMAGDVMLNASGLAVQVPAGHVWLEGDNASQSRDSRMFGPVPLENIRGQLTHLLWEPGRLLPMWKRI